MRPIDADKARENSTIDLITHFLDRQPTIEVEPVRHERWKESDFIPGMLTCTGCGVQRNPKFKLGGGAWNRCPNCGAIMDKEAESK